MSRRDTAVHYLLEHRIALLLAGFVVLFDQVGTDWWSQLHASGTREWFRLGALGVDIAPTAGPGAFALALGLAVAGALGLWRRAARTRLLPGTPSGAASELLVLAGAVALVLNLALRGAPLLPLTLEPVGWSVGPALCVALPAATCLGVEAARGTFGRTRELGTPRTGIRQ